MYEALIDFYPVLHVWRNNILRDKQKLRLSLFGRVAHDFGSLRDQSIASLCGYRPPQIGKLNGFGLKNCLEFELSRTTDKHFKRTLAGYLAKHGSVMDETFSSTGLGAQFKAEDFLVKLIENMVINKCKRDNKVSVAELISNMKSLHGVDLCDMSRITGHLSPVELLVYLGFTVTDDGKFVLHDLGMNEHCIKYYKKFSRTVPKKLKNLYDCKSDDPLEENQYNRQQLLHILDLWKYCIEQYNIKDARRLSRYATIAFYIGSDEHRCFAKSLKCRRPLYGYITACKLKECLAAEAAEVDVKPRLKAMIDNFL